MGIACIRAYNVNMSELMRKEGERGEEGWVGRRERTKEFLP